MAELKPCPFCGAILEEIPQILYRRPIETDPAEIIINWHGIPSVEVLLYYFLHPRCGCHLDGICIQDDDVEAWNRRADNGG